MSTRTPIGGQPRPPQRTVSASSLSVQRPSQQQRTFSQQFPPPSPVRKDGSSSSSATNYVDLTGDGAYDAARVAKGSRLRQELSIDSTGRGSRTTSETLSSTAGSSVPSSRALPLSNANDGGHQSPALSRSSAQDPDNLPMPMPKRRPRVQQPLHRTQQNDAVLPLVKKDSRPKPYVVEVPTAAPRCPPSSKQDKPLRDPFSKGLYSGFADFQPWTGKHHEDEWNSEGIQKGIWDRGNQTETGSARHAIYPPIRQQKVGLTALTQVFTSVLNQRRAKGQVNAPSTFKPPPRVTLTDTKREVWMKDLANPSVTLRRLSRTIPHGIRGRTLLDQCLNKRVPIERAVWLVKCVGANEIRAFKRKGVNGAVILGGEQKWARDWTVFVEQFLDAVVSSLSDDDWKLKVTYAIQLTTSIYSEHLLDRDHYLDWLLTNLESCPQTKLPLWILVVQIYQQDLTRSRKLGRRFALVLLGHLNTICNDLDRDLLMQLSDKIVALLTEFLRSKPENFINPRAWCKYRSMLKDYISPNDHALIAAYQHIDERNTRIHILNATQAPIGRQQLVAALDSSLKGHVDSQLAARCWATNDDKPAIMKTTVEWATSLHRPGIAKIYVAAGLLRTWIQQGWNPTTSILDTLDSVTAHDVVGKRAIYLLVGELVRSGHFSISHYLRWLIARGGYHEAAEADAETGACATRLLLELPLHEMADKWKRERANLLRRAGGYSVATEENDINLALKHVVRALGMPGPEDDPIFQKKPMPLRKLITRIQSSSRALQTAVGTHIRDFVVKEAMATKDQFHLPLSMFSTLRTMLETFEDFSMLSDVLLACRAAIDTDLLASCVDTVNCNLPVFMAIGSASPLLDAYTERLKGANGGSSSLARPLLAALAHLAARIPGRQTIATQLHQELLQADRANPIDACSPVSDNMVTQMQSAESEASDEIEKLFGTGNMVDQPTMNRLFRMMIPKLEAGWRNSNDSRRVFASLLTRLRVYDTKHFDKLMADWVSHVRSLKSRPPLSELIPLLVCLGCLSTSILLQTAAAGTAGHGDVAPSASDAPASASATYLQELLQLLLVPNTGNTVLMPEEAYRFRIHQQSAQSDHAKGMLSLLRNALAEYSTVRNCAGADMLPLNSGDCQERVLELLRSLVVIDTNAVASTLAIRTLPSDAVELVFNLTNRLLCPNHEPGAQVAQASFDDILGLANDLTMPFCQLKLNFDLSIEHPTTSAQSEESQGLTRFDLFARAMDRAIEADNISWTRMLPCLSNDITLHLKSQAYDRFLAMLPSMKVQALGTDATSHERIRMAENLLGVLEVIISGQPPPKTAQLTQVMVEKLSDLWEIISSRDESLLEAQAWVIDKWLPTLLRFITLHSTSAAEAMPAPSSAAIQGKAVIPPGQEARARIIMVLCGLLLELETRPSASTKDIPQHVFDTAVLLVDSLPDDIRTHCADAILFRPGSAASPNLSSDPRLYYLLSASLPSAADNLITGRRRDPPLPGHPQHSNARLFGTLYGCGPATLERFSPFMLKRWELLSEPTPNVGENDTSLSLGLFEAIKIQ